MNAENASKTRSFDLSCAVENRAIFGTRGRSLSTTAIQRTLLDESFLKAAQPVIVEVVQRHLSQEGFEVVDVGLQRISPVFRRTGMDLSAIFDVPRGENSSRLMPIVARTVGDKTVQSQVGEVLASLLRNRLTNDMS